jgi:hypothetical protein
MCDLCPQHGRASLALASSAVTRILEIAGQAIDSEWFTRNSDGFFPGVPVTGARDVPAPDRSPLKPDASAGLFPGAGADVKGIWLVWPFGGAGIQPNAA